MSTILTRCRDADMMGPICDIASDENPLTDTVRETRVNAAIHSEPEITDDDIVELEELIIGDEGCCCDGECC